MLTAYRPALQPLDSPQEIMTEKALLRRGVALPFEKQLLATLNDITASSPFRRMVTLGVVPLHEDQNERDCANLIVSASLGLPETFQFGGLKRSDAVKKFALRHGDVAVWGAPSSLSELKDGHHQIVGRMRVNLTFPGALSWPTFFSLKAIFGVSRRTASWPTASVIHMVGAPMSEAIDGHPGPVDRHKERLVLCFLSAISAQRRADEGFAAQRLRPTRSPGFSILILQRRA